MKRFWPLALALLLAPPGVASAQTGSPDEWEFLVTPFLWGIGMDGTVGLAGREQDFEASTKDLLSSLDFGIMGNFEARRNRWSFGADMVYTDLGKDASVDNVDVAALNPRLDMSMTILEGDVGYQIGSGLDLLAGVRGVSTSAALLTDQQTVREADGGFADPIVGARFRRGVSEKLWVQLRGDVGGFGIGSDFSWFVSAVAGVRVSKLLSFDFGYRTWTFDYQGDSDLKDLDLTLAGFGGGLTFHF